ncbi:SIS domain-containing protein [Patescibacteria group bacterium]|nr:SIS domain-containing protein [Patescibacteria group bacterium]
MDILKELKSKKYNSVFESIKLLPAQFESSLSSEIKFPPSYKNIKNVCLCGMGGSALSAHIVKALNEIKVPFCFYNGYEPPKFVGKDTLFIASSYSGNTEEVLAGIEEAGRRKAKICLITAGGKLGKKYKNLYPSIIFDTELNPSAQPRYGLGYSLGALFNILIKLDLIDYKMEYLKNISVGLIAPSLKKAEKMAQELSGKAPIVVASEFLEGNAHIFVNQINETAKVFSEYHSMPELNHHLMEGLKRPAINTKYLKFLFLDSALYAPKIIKRFAITKEVVKKNKIEYTEYKVSGKTQVEQALNFLFFGSLVSLVLAIFYKESPTDILWVKYFKSKL